MQRCLMIGAGVAIALIGLFWFGWVYPGVLRAKQVRSLADMQIIWHHVEEHRERTGAYPRALHEVIPGRLAAVLAADGWGGRWLYESDGDRFVLVSYGKDRKPDGTDYWALRESGPTADQDWEAARIAGLWNADQVVSDRGWLREAGK